jgi:hypothetical protein
MALTVAARMSMQQRIRMRILPHYPGIVSGPALAIVIFVSLTGLSTCPNSQRRLPATW